MYASGRSFKLTKDIAGRLTEKQRIFYEENGYLVVPRLVPHDILSRCSQRFDDLALGKVPRGMITVMKDVVDRKSVSKVQDIVHDEVFSEYIEYGPLLDMVECFTGPNIVAMHSMLIAKPPDVGSKSSRHPPHQDLWYFPFRPADRIVASWTAVEPCDTSNGCLYVSPGSHLLDRLYRHDYPKNSSTVNKFYHEIQDLPKPMTWVSLEAEPGDTLFFHPLLVHGSGVNRSNRTRKAISCHYASGECHYIDVQGTIQEPVSKEIMELVKVRYPTANIEYNDTWRMKSKVVRGLRSSL